MTSEADIFCENLALLAELYPGDGPQTLLGMVYEVETDTVESFSYERKPLTFAQWNLRFEKFFNRFGGNFKQSTVVVVDPEPQRSTVVVVDPEPQRGYMNLGQSCTVIANS